MDNSKYTIVELKQRQKLPLDIKVTLTKTRIKEWVEMYGLDGVYISFSGGKDSTVLLHIARQIFPDIKACFIDTGLEYPEIREFVKIYENVDWIKPEYTFRQVLEKYGYPIISKEVAEDVHSAKRYLEKLINEESDLKKYITNHTDRETITLNDIPEKELLAIITSEELKNIVADRPPRDGQRRRLSKLLGLLSKTGEILSSVPDNKKSVFNRAKWKFLLASPFLVGSQCCSIMKKNPAHKYTKETGRYPITAQMAEESQMRTMQWLKNGCNGFDLKIPTSNPMSFWTEQDVLQYIKINKIPIASVYGLIKACRGDQQDATDNSNINPNCFDLDNQTLQCTGVSRTGCMWCGFGIMKEKSPNRFERMKETHPIQYRYIMSPWEYNENIIDNDTGEGKTVTKYGLGYKEVLDWINKYGKLNIKY